MKLKALLILLVFIKAGFAQQVQPEWVKFYDGGGFLSAQDFGYSLVTDNQNNVIVSGTSQTEMSGEDIITIKYSASGNILWQKKHSGQGISGEVCYTNAIDVQNNIYSGGTGLAKNGWSYVVVKYDSEGNTKWVHNEHYSTNPLGYLGRIVTDNSLNVYYSVSTPGFGTELVKISPEGVTLWKRTMQGYGYGPAICEIDKATNTIITFCNLQDTGNILKITKISSNGDSLWCSYVKNYNAYNNFIPNDICVVNSDVYITATDNIKSLAVTLKYSPAGELLWKREYTNSNESASKKIAYSSSGYIYVGGNAVNNSYADFLVLKYSAEGNLVWDKTFDFNNSGEGFEDLCIDSDENIYISGISSGGCASVKINKDGNYLWSSIYRIKDNETSWGFSNGFSNNNFYVTGYGIGNGTGCDIITLKYGSMIGINPAGNSIPEKFSLSQNYPNPFNPTTNIEFLIADFGFVNLTVYDALGRVVETLVNSELKPGTYKADWNAAKYPSGVYFYRIAIHSDRLNTGSFTETKKMILIK